MSSLDSLMIQGIRTFSPDKPQVIKFYPITLILGHNGAGKTTIIESLRYITSGEFPPNTYRGKTWIHDPSLMKKKVKCVRSQVKLKFNDVYKNSPVATKNVELIVSHDRSGHIKTSIKTLDFTIKVTDQKTGEVKSLVSTKCAEVESLMLDHLGVSKAVLTNVIFCHQEESNWPLSESKQLKEKFDQIFGLTGYVKALKKIKDMRKSYLDSIRLVKKDLIYLQELKEQYESLEVDKAAEQARLDDLIQTEQKCERELLPVQKQFNEILSKEHEIGKLSEQIARISGFLEAELKSAEYYKTKISDLFEGSVEELQSYLDRFREKLISKETRSKDVNDILNQVEQEIVEKRNALERTQEKQNEILLNKRELNSLQEKLKQILYETCDELNLISCGGDESTKQTIQNYLKNQLHQVNEEMRDLNFQLKEVEKKVEKHKNDVVFSQQSNLMANKNISKLEYELETIRLQLNQSAGADSRLEQFEEELKSLNNLLASQVKSININKLEDEIRENKQNKMKLNQQVNEMMDKYKLAQKNRELNSRIADLESNLENKQTSISQILLKNRTISSKVQNKSQSETFSFSKEVKQRVEKLNLRFAECRKEKSMVERNLMANETELKSLEASRREYQNQIQGSSNRLYRVIGKDETTSEVLIKIENKLDLIKNNLHQCSFKRRMISEIIPMIPSENRCMICDSDLKEVLKKRQVVQKLKYTLDHLPADDLSLEKEAKQLEAKVNELKQLQLVENELSQLNVKLQSIEKKKNELSQNQVQLKKDLEEESDKFDKVDQELKSLQELLPDAHKYDDLNAEVNNLKTKLDKLKSELESGASQTESSEQIEFDLNCLREQLSDTEHLLDKLAKKRQTGFEQLENTKARLLKVEKDKVLLEKNQQAKARFRDEIQAKTNEIEQIKAEQVVTKQMLQEQQLSMSQAEAEKKEIVQKSNQLNVKKENLTFKMREFEAKVKDLEKEIKTISAKLENQHFENVNRNIEHLQAELETLKSQRAKAESKMKESRKLLEEAKQEERDLVENLEYLKVLERIESLRQNQTDLQSEMGAQDISSLLTLKQELQSKLQSLEQKKQVAISCRAPAQTRLEDIERNMKSSKFKDIHDSYNRKMLDLRMQTIVAEDLNKYYVALDKSVIIFHQRKMQEINSLIHRFWKQTYRGHDIDTIKIVSEEESISSSDARKSYNYRVVMIKGGVEMDMRGRCSAGQKVLACLIIRLALAEIFCVNCGVLALDEPTTNLDKQSILSFSESIRELLDSHNKYKNFQLIIITHDEEFLRCLDDENDYYYKITQDEEGHSCIEKHSIRDRE